MVAELEGALWTASEGGATRYDLISGKAEIFSHLDGLPSIDLAGILSLGDSLWTTSTSGDLCRLLPGSRTWESFGSYRHSGWSFNPRVLTASPDHSVLILGGDQGLSFFSTVSNLALDNLSSFGSLSNQKVHSVLVTSRARSLDPDTVWVGLQDGAAYAPVSDWSMVGRSNGILSDPSKWTVIQRVGNRPVIGFVRWFTGDRIRPVPSDTNSVTVYDTARRYDTLSSTTVRRPKIKSVTDSNGIHFDTTYVIDTVYSIDSSKPRLPLQITAYHTARLDDTLSNWATPNGWNTIRTASWGVYWNGAAWNVGNLGAVHALPFEGGLAICTPGNGLVVLRTDGTWTTPTPPLQLPSTPIHHVQLHSDGILDAWISKSIHRLPVDRSRWSASLLTPGSDKTSEMPTQAFGRDPQGHLLLATWGSGLWRSTQTPIWEQFIDANSCVLPAIRGTPAVVASAISPPNASGNWIGFHLQTIDTKLNQDSTSTLQIAFLPTSSTLRCLSLKERIDGVGEPIVKGFAQEGDSALWVAHANALLRYRIQGDSLALSTTASVKNATSILWLGNRLYALENGELKMLDKIGKAWKISTSDAGFLQGRSYRKLDADTLGNLWIAGDAGLDIVTPSDPSSLALAQRLEHANSGLLSNEVTDFSLDRASGTVAIATPLGLNLYQSRFKIRPDALLKEQIRPYPNPFRKLQHGKVVFPNISATAQLSIHSADGSLINHQTSKDILGDQFLWKPAPQARPGIYFWSISDGSTRLMGRLVVAD